MTAVLDFYEWSPWLQMFYNFYCECNSDCSLQFSSWSQRILSSANCRWQNALASTAELKVFRDRESSGDNAIQLWTDLFVMLWKFADPSTASDVSAPWRCCWAWMCVNGRWLEVLSADLLVCCEWQSQSCICRGGDRGVMHEILDPSRSRKQLLGSSV